MAQQLQIYKAVKYGMMCWQIKWLASLQKIHVVKCITTALSWICWLTCW